MLNGVVLAGRIIVHGAIGIAVSCAVSAGKIFRRIGDIRVGIEQAGGAAAIAHSARSAKPNLHQTIIAGVDDARIATALTPDNTGIRLSGTLLAAACLAISASRFPLASSDAACRCCAETGDAQAASAIRIVVSESLQVMSPPLLAEFYATHVGDIGHLARNSGEFVLGTRHHELTHAVIGSTAA
jgi:hypothetical protein